MTDRGERSGRSVLAPEASVAPVRVLIVSNMYTRHGEGGAGESIHRQALGLARLGVSVTAIRPRPLLERRGFSGSLRPAATEQDGPIRIFDAPFWNLPVRHAPALNARAVVRAVRHVTVRNGLEGVDLVHAHRLYPNGHVALDLARRLGVPALVSARGSDVHTHPHRMPGVKRLVTEVVEQADRVLAVSRDLAARIEGLATPSVPVRVVYNGVDSERFAPAADRAAVRARLGLPKEGVGLCFVGRLVEAKGLVELFEAFEALASEQPDLWLAAVGAGPLRDLLQSRAQAAGVGHRVFLPGALPHDRVPGWVQAADLFVLPSHNEGLPNVALEAMATGIPVVSTRIGGIPEAVADGRTGQLIPVGDVPALRQALGTLIRDEGRRRAMGRAGLNRVREAFTWERSAASLLAVYREVLGT